jgi:hypothetical protein
MVFGPDGTNDGKLDLYVAATHVGTILRYDGTTGAFKGVFVSVGSGGLDAPQGMVFGADGDLYVASGNWFTSSNGPFYSGDFPAGAVLRFEGPSGPNPGAFLGTFVPGGSGGLANPNGILFGPDPSGNGHTDLYVASSALHAGVIAKGGTSQVLRYEATTGAFLGSFVTPDSGGLKFATFLTFTETNPTTLNYDGTASATASSSRPQSVAAASSLTPERLTADSALAVILAGGHDGGSFLSPYLAGVLASAQAHAARQSPEADSFNVRADGAAVGAANNAMLNVYEQLKAVDQQAVNDVRYDGDTTLSKEANDLFDALNQAGAIS